MKDKPSSPYFAHLADTRNQDQLIRLRMRHGVAGYGVYWMLMERLRMAEDYASDFDCKVLAFDFKCQESLIQSVVCDFGLFAMTEDGKRFYSPELRERMLQMELSSSKRREAARKAAEARWGVKTDGGKGPASITEAQPQGTTSQPNAEPSGDKSPTATDKPKTLENELGEMRSDQDWADLLCAEFQISKEIFGQWLDHFILHCRRKGLKAHESIVDAKTHLRSFLLKQKDLSAPELFIAVKKTQKAGNRRESIDEQMERREAEYRKMMETSQSADNYIRNYGYDPANVDMLKAGNARWRKENPPTHPEWIGKFDRRQVLAAAAPF